MVIIKNCSSLQNEKVDQEIGRFWKGYPRFSLPNTPVLLLCISIANIRIPDITVVFCKVLLLIRIANIKIIHITVAFLLFSDGELLLFKQIYSYHPRKPACY